MKSDKSIILGKSTQSAGEQIKRFFYFFANEFECRIMTSFVISFTETAWIKRFYSVFKKKSCNLPTKLETIFLDPWRGREGRGVGEVFFSILEVLMVINWKNTSTL